MIRYRCPQCGKQFSVERREDAPRRPFCSERCQLIDLGKWLNGEYVISDSLLPDPGNASDSNAQPPAPRDESAP